jgi:hypothetical protein
MNFSRTNDKIILIDGGLGTTLQEYGLDVLNDPLWLIILKENLYLYLIVFYKVWKNVSKTTGTTGESTSSVS